MSLVLSLFPGGGLLDHAFALEGFCVVRGPDPLWGGDIREFNPPTGAFSGVIGGPPCQSFSLIGNVNRARWGEDSVMPNLIPEFERVVGEAAPAWFLMENSLYAPNPVVDGYGIGRFDLDLAWLGEPQRRLRRFWFGSRAGSGVPAGLVIHCDPSLKGSERTVSSKGSVDWKGSRSREGNRTLGDMMELQGIPPDWFGHSPFKMEAKRKIVGNAVAVPVGRAIARAVRKATRQGPQSVGDILGGGGNG